MAGDWTYTLVWGSERFELADGETTVGRSRHCNVSISDASVSRQHVVLEPTGRTIRVRDLGSSNGTFVNGRRVSGQDELEDGSALRLGDAELGVLIEGPPEAVQPVATPPPSDDRSVGEATTFLAAESMRLAEATQQAEGAPHATQQIAVPGLGATVEMSAEQIESARTGGAGLATTAFDANEVARAQVESAAEPEPPVGGATMALSPEQLEQMRNQARPPAGGATMALSAEEIERMRVEGAPGGPGQATTVLTADQLGVPPAPPAPEVSSAPIAPPTPDRATGSAQAPAGEASMSEASRDDLSFADLDESQHRPTQVVPPDANSAEIARPAFDPPIEASTSRPSADSLMPLDPMLAQASVAPPEVPDIELDIDPNDASLVRMASRSKARAAQEAVGTAEAPADAAPADPPPAGPAAHEASGGLLSIEPPGDPLDITGLGDAAPAPPVFAPPPSAPPELTAPADAPPPAAPVPDAPLPVVDDLAPPPPAAAPLSFDQPMAPAAPPPTSFEPQLRQPSASADLLPSLDQIDAAMGDALGPTPQGAPGTQAAGGRFASVDAPTPGSTQPPAPPVAPAAAASTVRGAGFFVRLGAYVVDVAWITALSFAGVALSGDQLIATGISIVGWLGVMIGWAVWGTSPGKRVFGLYVVGPDGYAGIGFGRAVLRWIGYWISALPLGLGFLMIAFTADRRGLHDRIAGTLVRHP